VALPQASQDRSGSQGQLRSLFVGPHEGVDEVGGIHVRIADGRDERLVDLEHAGELDAQGRIEIPRSRIVALRGTCPQYDHRTVPHPSIVLQSRVAKLVLPDLRLVALGAGPGAGVTATIRTGPSTQ